MSMFKFLHLADVHLDTTFVCRSPALRSRLREALRLAFERAVDCAVAEEVDAVLIAGDLFDGHRLSFRTEQFLVEQARRLDAHGITTVYVSGNHDPAADRFRSASFAWPESFHYISEGTPESLIVVDRSGEPAARVVGAGHASNRERSNLARRFPAADERLPHVGLLHTMVTGARDDGEHDRYAPCGVSDLRKPGYRYWALGHIHVRQQVCDQSNAYYSGNLQGRHHREVGPKGGLLVTLRDGLAPDVQFRSFAPVRWVELHLDDLSAAESLHATTDAIRAKWDEQVSLAAAEGGGDADWMLRVSLSGETPLYERLVEEENLRDLADALGGSLGVLDVEVRVGRLSPPIDLTEHRNQPHVLGEVLSLLEEAETDDALLQALAPAALAAFGGREEEARSRYLRDLLQGLDREVAMHFLMHD